LNSLAHGHSACFGARFAGLRCVQEEYAKKAVVEVSNLPHNIKPEVSIQTHLHTTSDSMTSHKHGPPPTRIDVELNVSSHGRLAQMY
jgi:hypothetical protein